MSTHDIAIKAGDIVKLKSGGPDMTVSGVSANEAVCVWFDDEDAHQKVTFVLATLEAVESDS